MSNYTKTTDFEAKDSLPSGDSGKIIRGSEFETEFDNIATAIASKSDANNPTFTGTVTIDGLTVNGNTVLGNAATDTVTVTADIASNLLPSADDTYNLGAVGAEWNDLHVDGVAYIDTIDGFATTGNVTFGDNDKAIFGASSDLQIYHTGSPSSNSVIEDAGAGNLTLKSNGAGIHFRDGSDNLVFNVDLDSATTLYHNTSAKLTTTATGIDVTGSISADGLTVDGSSSGDITLTGATNSNTGIFVKDPTAATYGAFFGYDDANTVVHLGGVTDGTKNAALVIGRDNNIVQFSGGGDVQFYEDTGTTVKMNWDSSKESLGIGVGSPQASLHIANDASRTQFIASGTVGNDRFLAIDLDITGSEDVTYITCDQADSLAFGEKTNDSDRTIANEHMRIDPAGNVGIGTSSPAKLLDVSSNSSPTIRISNTRNDSNWDTDPVFGALEFYSADGSGSGASVRASVQAEAASAFGNATDIVFRNGDSLGVQQENMRIDYQGNVGIGTDSPSQDLEIASTFPAIRLTDTDTSNAVSEITGGSGILALSADGTNAVANSRIVMNVDGSERVRIDASGDLLIGKTSTSLGTAGIVGYGAGLLRSTRSGGIALELNRTSSDGSIADFKKDGATVGSVGTASGGWLYTGAVDTALVYDYGANSIQPYQPNTSSLRDNAVDLGGLNARFRDLYLSGGAYLGGTTAANKLDDYEEGTWTPTILGVNGFTVGASPSYSATYTKIGRLVYFTVLLDFDSTDTVDVGDRVLVSNLPFTRNSAIETITGVGTAVTYNSYGTNVLAQGTVGLDNSTVISVVITNVSGSLTHASGTRLSGTYIAA